MSEGRDPNSRNRRNWNDYSDEYQQRHGAVLEGSERAWGCWRIPESEVGALGAVAGLDVLELGCGAANWSLPLMEDGARVVGLDLSDRQLTHARRRARERRLRLPLILASGESIPFADASFDLVFCDHGAMNFSDPYRTVPEVARVLRADGRFVFSGSTPLRDLCAGPESGLPGERLVRSYFDLHRFEDDGAFVYQLPYGEWIRLFRAARLEVEDLAELRPPAGATTSYDDFVSLDWSRRWPSDHIWKLRRRS